MAEMINGKQLVSSPLCDKPYGGIREISVLDPPPGTVGLTNVVSIKVQFSPLNPQIPYKTIINNSRRPFSDGHVPVWR